MTRVLGIIALIGCSPVVGYGQPLNTSGPASTAFRLNDELKAILVRSYKPSTEQSLELAESLRKKLSETLLLDKQLESLSPAEPLEKRISDETRRFRALALIHGWASLSELVESVRDNERWPKLRLQLLGLGQAENPSALELLLRLHGQVQSRETEPEPYHHLLGTGGHIFAYLSYREVWGKSGRPKTVDHDFFIPAVADLVGQPSDRDRSRKLHSLWSLINLMIAELPHRSNRGELELSDLANWLQKFSGSTLLLAGLNQPMTVPSRGSQLKARITKLAQFVRFRDLAQQKDALDNLVLRIAQARHGHNLTGMRVEAQGGKLNLDDLIAAAYPVSGDEPMPQARIWLSHLFVLSYRYEGSSVVGKTSRNSPEQWWDACFPALKGLLLPIADDKSPRSELLVQYGHWPTFGHSGDVLANLTMAVLRYCRMDASLPELVQLRQEAISTPKQFDRYQKAAAEASATFAGIFRDHLHGYCSRDGWNSAGWSKSNTFDPWAKPYEGTSNDQFREVALLTASPTWSKTASLAEQVRWRGDIHDYAFQSLAMAEIQGRTQGLDEGYTQRMLAGWRDSGMSGLLFNSPGVLPAQTFQEARQQVEDASKRLQQQVKEFLIENELQARWAAKKDEVAALQLEKEAAKLGLEIAQTGLELANVFRQIAELEKSIKLLLKEAREFDSKVGYFNQEAASKQLVRATRLRDLTVARVHALEESVAQAEKMIEQAANQLGRLKQQLLSAANRIESERRRGAIIGIVKAAISVVGAALAPFTGGASAVVAIAATQTLDLVLQVTEIDFGNLEAAVGKLGQAVGKAVQIADSTIGKLGSDNTKKSWADIKQWVHRQETAVRDLTSDLSKDAQKLVDGIRTVAPAQAQQLLHAALADIPIRFDAKEGVILEFRNPIHITDKLQEYLAPLLDHGMLVNSLAQRLGGLNELPFLKDRELREKLKTSIRDGFRALPPAVLASLKKDVKEVEARLYEAKKRLFDYVDSADEKTCQAIGRLLGGGVLFIKDARGRVIALQRPMKDDLANFKARVDAIKTKVISETISGMVAKVEARFKRLQAHANDAQGAKDDGALRALANERIAQEIEGTQQDLAELKAFADWPGRPDRDK